MLEIPFQPAGVRVERERGTGEQRLVAGPGATADAQPGLGLGHPPISKVEGRIVAAGNPRLAAGAQQIGQFAPRVAARLAFSRNRAETPGLLAGPCVIGADVAFRAVTPAARHPRQNLAVDDDRSGCIAVSLLPSAIAVCQTILPVRVSSA